MTTAKQRRYEEHERAIVRPDGEKERWDTIAALIAEDKKLTNVLMAAVGQAIEREYRRNPDPTERHDLLWVFYWTLQRAGWDPTVCVDGEPVDESDE